MSPRPLLQPSWRGASPIPPPPSPPRKHRHSLLPTPQSKTRLTGNLSPFTRNAPSYRTHRGSVNNSSFSFSKQTKQDSSGLQNTIKAPTACDVQPHPLIFLLKNNQISTVVVVVVAEWPSKTGIQAPPRGIRLTQPQNTEGSLLLIDRSCS